MLHNLESDLCLPTWRLILKELKLGNTIFMSEILLICCGSNYVKKILKPQMATILV